MELEKIKCVLSSVFIFCNNNMVLYFLCYLTFNQKQQFLFILDVSTVFLQKNQKKSLYERTQSLPFVSLTNLKKERSFTFLLFQNLKSVKCLFC